jgi:hypothetical protein
MSLEGEGKLDKPFQEGRQGRGVDRMALRPGGFGGLFHGVLLDGTGGLGVADWAGIGMH